MPLMLAAIETGTDVTAVPGAVTAVSKGPPPSFVHWLVSPERALEDLRSIREPGVFIVDDDSTARAIGGYLCVQSRRSPEAGASGTRRTFRSTSPDK